MRLQTLANIAQILSTGPAIYGVYRGSDGMTWGVLLVVVVATLLVVGVVVRFLPPRGSLVILHAFCGGTEGSYKDLRAKLAAYIERDRIDMRVDQRTLYKPGEDPFRGQRKHLITVYSVGGVIQPPVTTDEDATLNIP